MVRLVDDGERRGLLRVGRPGHRWRGPHDWQRQGPRGRVGRAGSLLRYLRRWLLLHARSLVRWWEDVDSTVRLVWSHSTQLRRVTPANNRLKLTARGSSVVACGVRAPQLSRSGSPVP